MCEVCDDLPVWVVVESGPEGVSVAGVYVVESEAHDCARFMRCYYDNEHSKAHLYAWTVHRSEISA
jgi:hypothetical protein